MCNYIFLHVENLHQLKCFEVLLEFSGDHTRNYNAISGREAHFNNEVRYCLPSRTRSIFYYYTINFQKVSMNFKRCKFFWLMKFKYISLINTYFEHRLLSEYYYYILRRTCVKDQNPEAYTYKPNYYDHLILEVLERHVDVKYLCRL